MASPKGSAPRPPTRGRSRRGGERSSSRTRRRNDRAAAGGASSPRRPRPGVRAWREGVTWGAKGRKSRPSASLPRRFRARFFTEEKVEPEVKDRQKVVASASGDEMKKGDVLVTVGAV